MKGVRSWWRWLSERWLAAGFFTLAAFLLASALTGERGLPHLRYLRGELATTNDANFRLTQSIHNLRERADRLRNDDAYLARVARRRYSLVRPGELLFKIHGDSGSSEGTPRGTSSPRR